MQDLTKQECEQYLTDLCKIPSLIKEISCFVTDVMPLTCIRKRLLDLNSVKKIINDESLENAQESVHYYVRAQTARFRLALLFFLQTAREIPSDLYLEN